MKISSPKIMSKPKIIEKDFLIKKYINEKLSVIEIAEICNCSSTIVYKYMATYNIDRRTIQEALRGKMIGDENPNFRHGKKVRKYFKCIECGKPVTHGCFSGLCKSCSHKGDRAYNYINGYSSRYIKHYCIDCKREKSINAKNGRCERCNAKWQVGKNNPNYGNGDKIKGDKNPNWIDGRSHLDYPVEFNKELKLKIRSRDNYICQNCGMTEEEHLIVYGTNLTVHHIDYNKNNCSENNLITLCDGCNLRANWNREYWKQIYIDKINILISK